MFVYSPRGNKYWSEEGKTEKKLAWREIVFTKVKFQHEMGERKRLFVENGKSTSYVTAWAFRTFSNFCSVLPQGLEFELE